MPETIPSPADSPAPKPRRPYRITDRGRAASRNNLKKAWEASRRHWEKTPARLASSRRTIQLAQAANRQRPRKLSPAQLNAVRANVARARDALAARGRSPEHLAKLRQTIALARATRTAKSFRKRALKLLKHGLFARSLKESLRPLGEDRLEYARHYNLLRLYFAARGPEDAKIVHAAAEAIARRRRLWRAEAYWQARHLDQLLGMTRPLAVPEPHATLERSMVLLDVLTRQERLIDLDRRLMAVLERILRQLVRKRSGGKLDLKVWGREAYRPRQEDPELERQRRDDLVWSRLLNPDREVKAILERFRPFWMRKRGADPEGVKSQ